MKRLLLLLLVCGLLGGCGAESVSTPTNTQPEPFTSFPSNITQTASTPLSSQEESVVPQANSTTSLSASSDPSSLAQTQSAIQSRPTSSLSQPAGNTTPPPSASSTPDKAEPVYITQGGDYSLSGIKQDVMVTVDAPEQVVTLTLSGVTIANSKGPALYIAAAKKVNIILAKDTQNVLSDGKSYAITYGTTTLDATLFSRSDLCLSGEGTLQVQGNYKHGIVSKDDLVIDDGTYQVTAKNVALEGKDCVKIKGGTLTLKAGSDGIRSSNLENPQKGYITVEGGVLKIDAGSDGLQAATNVTVTEGELQVTATASGVQAQGNYLQTGGKITLFGTHGSGKAVFNVKTASTIEGGALFAFGDSAKARHLTNLKSGCALLLPFAAQKAGTPFTLKNQNKTVVTVTPPKAYSSALIYSPALTTGEYTLTLGSQNKSFSVNNSRYVLQ